MRKRILAGVVGAAVAATIAGAAPAGATPTIQVTALFVNAVCQGGDFARVTLSAQSSGATGEVRYKWDWTNNGSFDTRALANPQASHLYLDEINVTARVGARDSTGAIAVDTIQFATPRCE